MPSKSVKKAKEITDNWFVIDGKEKYLSELDTIIATALDQARQEGRREGIEEAAKVVNGMRTQDTPHGTVYCPAYNELATARDAIRNLLTEKGK